MVYTPENKPQQEPIPREPLAPFRMTPIEQLEPEMAAPPPRSLVRRLAIPAGVVATAAGLLTAIGLSGNPQRPENNSEPQQNNSPAPNTPKERFAKLPDNAALVMSSNQPGATYSLYVSTSQIKRNTEKYDEIHLHARTPQGLVTSTATYRLDGYNIQLTNIYDVEKDSNGRKTTIAAGNLHEPIFIYPRMFDQTHPSEELAAVIKSRIDSAGGPQYLAWPAEVLQKSGIECGYSVHRHCLLETPGHEHLKGTGNDLKDLENLGRQSVTMLAGAMKSVGLSPDSDTTTVAALAKGFAPKLGIEQEKIDAAKRIQDDIKPYMELVDGPNAPSSKIADAIKSFDMARLSEGDERKKHFGEGAEHLSKAAAGTRTIRGMLMRQQKFNLDNPSLATVMGQNNYDQNLKNYRQNINLTDTSLTELNGYKRAALDLAEGKGPPALGRIAVQPITPPAPQGRSR